jgi:hypothetical protein
VRENNNFGFRGNRAVRPPRGRAGCDQCDRQGLRRREFRPARGYDCRGASWQTVVEVHVPRRCRWAAAGDRWSGDCTCTRRSDACEERSQGPTRTDALVHERVSLFVSAGGEPHRVQFGTLRTRSLARQAPLLARPWRREERAGCQRCNGHRSSKGRVLTVQEVTDARTYHAQSVRGED